MNSNITKSLSRSSLVYEEDFKNLIKNDLRELNNEMVNSHALKVTKYYKNQKPYSGEEPYTDDLFPPNFQSLMGYDEQGNPKDENFEYEGLSFNKENITWKRASELFPDKYAIFEGAINQEDIQQGLISDCYFLCALASLTKYPQTIIQNFRHLKVQKNGYYEICMKIDGIWQIVIIDDYFPMNEEELICAHPSGYELWVILLEKAWAKVNGGYNYINFGFAMLGFEAFTNFFYKSFYCTTEASGLKKFDYYQKALKFNDNSEDLSITSKEDLVAAVWEKLKFLKSQKAFMVAASIQPKDGSLEFLRTNGIVTHHQYSLIDLYEGLVNNTNIRLVKLRNPWAKIEFNGRWSDNSEEWTDEARKVFNYYSKQDDGSFHMEISDFLDNFLYIESCRIVDPLCSKTITIEKGYEDKVYAYDFLIGQTSFVNFNLIKKSRRFHKSIPLKTKQNIDLLIVKQEKEAFRFIYRNFFDEDFDSDRHILHLEPGKYLVFLRFDMNDFKYDKVRKINFIASCNNHFLFDLNSKEINPHVFDIVSSDKRELVLKDAPYEALTKKKLNQESFGKYDYFFKHIQINLDNFIEKIDQYQINHNYYQSICPKHIHIIDKLAPLEPEELKEYQKTIKSHFDFPKIGIREIYLVGVNEVATGRAAIHLRDNDEMRSIDNDFIAGYLYQGQLDGRVISYVNNIFSEYHCKDFIKNGEEKIYLRDGKVKKALWEDNKLISEEFVNEENIYMTEYGMDLFKEFVYDEDNEEEALESQPTSTTEENTIVNTQN